MEPFSPDYSLCRECGTLVSQTGLTDDQFKVADDEHDFYGKNYWFSHQVEEFGFPDIQQRARQDLPERCLHWLKILLKYRHPSAKVLELGCAHGGFVALLNHAGFSASGLEVSPWVVEFAKRTFDIPVFLGPIEEQNFQPNTFDVICLFDVLEHLSDPLITMRHVASLLKPDGILVIQMPNFSGESYAELQEENSSFLGMMQSEHIHLFTRESACQLLEGLGFSHIKFERPLYLYDMFLVAGQQELVEIGDNEIARSLTFTRHSRIIQALLDKEKSSNLLELRSQESLRQYQSLFEQYQVLDASRAKSLDDIQRQSEQIIAQLKRIEGLAQEGDNLRYEKGVLEHEKGILEHEKGILKREKGILENEKIFLIEIKKILAIRQESLAQARDILVKEKETLISEKYELEEQNLNLHQQLSALSKELESSHSLSNHLKQNLESKKTTLDQLKKVKEDVERQLNQVNQLVKMRDGEIEAMKSSKFWKLRSHWFRLKRLLGIKEI